MKVDGNRIDFEVGDIFIWTGSNGDDEKGDTEMCTGYVENNKGIEFVLDNDKIDNYFNRIEAKYSEGEDFEVREPFSITLEQTCDGETIRKEGFGYYECISRGSIEGLLIYKIHDFERAE